MLVFACPSCGAKLQMSDDLAGKKVRCASCQGVVTAPLHSEGSDAIRADAAPAAPSAASPTAVTAASKPRSSKAGAAVADEPEDRPRRRGDGGKAAAAVGAGLGIGTVLAVVGGLLAVLCLCGGGGIAVALLLPAVQKVREASARVETSNHMKMIGIACHNFHDVNRTLPSPKMTVPQSADLSWRVSLLPYMDQINVFNALDKNAAWDNPRNQQLLSPMPMPYHHVLREPEKKGTDTLFQYFTGPKTLWPNPTDKMSLIKITDGTSNTFMFAEAASGVPWTKPADMAIQPGQPLPLPPDRFMACMCDGSVRMVIRSRAPDPVLHLYIDPNDGQLPPPLD
jgi:hypothetical protein